MILHQVTTDKLIQCFCQWKNDGNQKITIPKLKTKHRHSDSHHIEVYISLKKHPSYMYWTLQIVMCKMKHRSKTRDTIYIQFGSLVVNVSVLPCFVTLFLTFVWHIIMKIRFQLPNWKLYLFGLVEYFCVSF